jgi:hypothetical protein
MKVYIDDVREPIMSYYSTNNPIFLDKDWVILRTKSEIIEFINRNWSEIDFISLDHDLGDLGEREFTGKTVVDYLIDKFISNIGGGTFPDWYVHSDNIVGRGNIISSILNYMKNFEGVPISDYKYYHRGYYDGYFI